jgi:PAS domain S-box-containing protein
MFTLDMRTAVFSFILISIISTFVIILLLRQYQNRYKGVQYILYCFALQTSALILIVLRNNIPAWISFDLANAMSVAGIILFYMGIESYMGKKSSRFPNLVILIIFTAIHTWFTFGRPNLGARYLNLSIVSLIVFIQCLWLLFRRAPKSKSRFTYPVSLVFIAFSIVCIVRIIKYFITGYNYEDYFEADVLDTMTMLVYQMLLILLTYSISHMFGRQLLHDIKSEEEKFSKAFHTSPYAIILSRLSDGHVLEINKGFIDKTGYSYEDAFGKTTMDLHFWLKKEDRDSIVEELHDSGKVYQRELQFRKKYGELITALFSAEIITINNEECIFSSVDDITERKKYEEKLVRSKEQAEESDRLKTSFIHNISHEIRTPLNAIVGFSSIIGDPDLNKNTKNSYIEIINKSSDHLLSIVNDIIEISNIEAGILKLKKDETDLSSIMNNLFMQFSAETVGKDIELRTETCLSDDRSYILTDKTKLSKILSSLLHNAIKFTDKGRVEFGYKLKNNFLEFYVSDTGIGIPGELHERIFDRFYQVDPSGTRLYDGTGLGLSISKAYITLLGGKIWVESEFGKGSKFFFTLPFNKIETTVPISLPVGFDSSFIRKVSVLIAEDDDNNFNLVAEYITDPNITLIRAKNGIEAVRYCESGQAVDLVLMDLKMPEMDGYEATTRVKKLLPNLPVIAQSAFVNDNEKAYKSGCIDIITKPFRKKELLGIIEKYLNNQK